MTSMRFDLAFGSDAFDSGLFCVRQRIVRFEVSPTPPKRCFLGLERSSLKVPPLLATVFDSVGLLSPLHSQYFLALLAFFVAFGDNGAAPNLTL